MKIHESDAERIKRIKRGEAEVEDVRWLCDEAEKLHEARARVLIYAHRGEVDLDLQVWIIGWTLGLSADDMKPSADRRRLRLLELEAETGNWQTLDGDELKWLVEMARKGLES